MTPKTNDKHKKYFELGGDYRELKSRSFRSIFVGYGCVIFSFVVLLFAVYSFSEKLTTFAILLFVGLGFLWIGYGDKKGLKEYERVLKRLNK